MGKVIELVQRTDGTDGKAVCRCGWKLPTHIQRTWKLLPGMSRMLSEGEVGVVFCCPQCENEFVCTWPSGSAEG
jgi:hypothetical protein